MRRAIQGLIEKFKVSQRRACRVLGQSRNTTRYAPQPRPDEPPLVARMIQLACMYGRYGYRRIGAMLRWEGWRVNHKRIERLWRCAGLKVPITYDIFRTFELKG